MDPDQDPGGKLIIDPPDSAPQLRFFRKTPESQLRHIKANVWTKLHDNVF
jgi:hypothetical protein